MNTLTCMNCKARFPAPQPTIAVLNNPAKCVVVMDPVRVRCPNPLCGREYISAIGGVQLQL